MKTFFKVILSMFLLFSFSKAMEFRVDNVHSEVGFSVKHLMITNVKGKFDTYNGQMEFDKKSYQFKSLTADINTASIDTGIEKRDNHLRSEDFFFAQKYPDIKFKMTKYSGDKSGGKMTGELTMRGVTKTVTLDVEIGGVMTDFKDNTRLGFTLSGTINRYDYGLEWNKALELGGVTVGEEVDIIVEIQAVEIK